MDEIKLLSDVRLLSEAVIELNISRKNVELYPPDHPIIKESIDRALEHLKKLLKSRSAVTLGIAKNMLVIDDFTLDKKNPVFQDFALSLYGKGIAAITFYSGLDVKDLVILHELIIMREGPIGNALVQMAEMKDLRHIKLSPVDLSVFEFKEGELRRGVLESKILEDYVFGLLEGRLADRDAEDLIHKVPPEEIASLINSQMPEDAPGEACDKVISAYLREKSKQVISREIFKSFLVFLENLRTELKSQFLSRTLSHHLSENEFERILAELKEEDLRKLIEIFEISSVTIPISLKNLLDKLSETTEKGEFFFDVTAKGKAFVDDIEIDKGMVRLLEEDHFHTFVSEEYQKELELMIRGVEAEESQLTKKLKQDSGERVLDKALSDVILELLESDSINNEDYLKLVTKLSGLVDSFLSTGRFQELCDIYNTMYSYSLSGKFKIEALGMIDYFFRSEQFISKLIEAFKFLGKYDTESAVSLAKVFKFYIISPLLDAFSEEANPNIRKFLIYLLSKMGVDVANEAAERLNDKRLGNLISMIALIKECGGKDYAKHIRHFAKDKNKRIRTEAINTLLYFGDREGLSYLKISLRGDDPEIKEQAILLAGTYKVKDAVPYLIEIIEKKDIFGSQSYSKLPAIKALAQIGDPQAIEPLKKLYRSKGFFFRGARNELKSEIFKSLKYYPVYAIKPLLELGIQSKDTEIRSISMSLLKEIHSRENIVEYE
ncbi:MAG: HEAT repeat domain-containing protein [Nitrospirota bacterium]